MHYLPFLKAGSKRSNSVYRSILCILTLFSTAVPLSGDSLGDSFFDTSEEGTLILSYLPESVPELIIKKNIEDGHRSEIFITYRIQLSAGTYLSIGGEYQEINIRRTGGRDRITGDYVLMLNGREVAVYKDWNQFFTDFSSPIIYPSRILINDKQKFQVKIRMRIIYKKLVPPFSMMYLLPGKFMISSAWQDTVRKESQ